MKKHGKKSGVLVLAVVALLVFVAHSEAMMGGGMMMQMPAGEQMFFYGPITSPVTGSDAAGTMPIGVGSVAMGGNMATVHATVGPFAGPVDMYVTVYAPAMDPFNIYMVHQDGSLHPASMGFAPWMQGVTDVDQDIIGNMPVSSLPKGTYSFGLMVTPSGSNMSSFYMWMTNATIQ
jgi:hypothetical protein